MLIQGNKTMLSNISQKAQVCFETNLLGSDSFLGSDQGAHKDI